MKKIVCFGTGKVYQVFWRMYNENVLEFVGGGR